MTKKITKVACHRLAMLVAVLGATAACGQANDPASRIERAREHQANAEYRTSMIELKNALQEEPENVEARIMLGEVSLAMGQTEAAEKEFTRAAGLGAPDSRIRMQLGEALLSQGAYEAVLSRFQAGEDDGDQDRYEIHLLRGQALLSMRDNGAAQREFEQALALRPDGGRPMLGLAAIAIAAGATEEPAQLIERALQSEPDLVEAWLAKGQLHNRLGNYTVAEAAYAGALERTSNVLQMQIALIGLAEVALAQNDTDKASAVTERLRQVAPGNYMVGYLRGRIHAASADYKAAEVQFQQVLTAVPEHTPSKLMLGVVSFAQGNLATADSYLNSALAADPGNVQARKLLAQIRMRLDQPEDVLSALEPAIQGGQADAGILMMSGQARLRMGEFDEGIALLERSVEAEPDNRDLKFRLAASYLLAGRDSDARELLESMPDESDGLPRREILLFLADIQVGRTAGAEARADAMLAARPDDADLNYLIGNSWVSAGHTDRARASYERVVEINPDYASAVINLARLDNADGDLAAAEARLSAYLEGHPDDTNIMVAMAQVAELKGDGDAVGSWLEKAVNADPQASAPKLMLARSYLIRADYQRAEELAAEVQQVIPDNTLALQIVGLAQLGRGNHEQASRTLGRAAEARPNSVQTLFGLAVSQLAINDTRSATASLARVIELQPDNVRAKGILAGLRIRSGELAEAEQLIDQIESQEAGNGLPHTLRGDLHVARGEHAAAAAAYDRAADFGMSRSLAIRSFNARQRAGDPDRVEPLSDWLAEYPDDRGVRLTLAQAHQAAGRDHEAMREYGLVLEQDDSNAVALNNLAWLQHTNGEPGAVDLAARAHALQPESGAVADTYGWILVENGEVDKGLDVLRDAADKEPDIGEIRYHLAVALAKSGESGEARELLRQLLDSGAPFESRSEAEALLRSL